jgi:hypothetical protein
MSSEVQSRYYPIDLNSEEVWDGTEIVASSKCVKSREGLAGRGSEFL